MPEPLVVKPFTSAAFNLSLRGAGQNMYENTNMSITQGFEAKPESSISPGGPYLFGSAAIGNEFIYSSNKTLNPSREPMNSYIGSLTAGGGINRTGPGLFAEASSTLNIGNKLHTTDLANTGGTFKGDLGYRKLQVMPNEYKDALLTQHGAFIQSDMYQQNPYAKSELSFGYKGVIREIGNTVDKSAFITVGPTILNGQKLGFGIGVGGNIRFSTP